MKYFDKTHQQRYILTQEGMDGSDRFGIIGVMERRKGILKENSFEISVLERKLPYDNKGTNRKMC